MTRTCPNPFADNDLQAGTSSPQPATPDKARAKRGKKTIDYPASISPTVKDIIMVAQFYDDEGNIIINKGQIRVTIGQNDREKLDWARSRFGGKVYGPYTNMAGNDTHCLVIVRERALGFMFTIFKHLSTSRREQFKAILAGKPQKRIYQRTISDDGISEAYVKRCLESSIKRSRKVVKGVMSLFGVKK